MSSKHRMQGPAGATGFSADKVGVMGFSAGGHTAASTASTIGAFKPPFDPLLSGHHGRTPERAPAVVRQPAGNGPHGRTVGILLAQNRVTEATPPTLLSIRTTIQAYPRSTAPLLRSAQAPRREGFVHIYRRVERLGLPRTSTRSLKKPPCWVAQEVNR